MTSPDPRTARYLLGAAFTGAEIAHVVKNELVRTTRTRAGGPVAQADQRGHRDITTAQE